MEFQGRSKKCPTPDQKEKSDDFLSVLSEKFHSAYNAASLIPSGIIVALGSAASHLSGKVETKTLAKDINHLSLLLKEKLSSSTDVEGIFMDGCNIVAKKKLLEILKKTPKKLKSLDSIEGIQINSPLIAEALTELSRRYFEYFEKGRLIRRKGNEMADALKNMQEALYWIVENKEKTQMSWTHLMIFAPSLFKLMKAENQKISFKGSDPVEKEFLSLVLNKLMESPGDTQRENMLLPIMNQFAKTNDETRQKLLNSIRTI